jgi:phosphopantetheine adenylyltransferase/predicted metal-dependent HD superfamily phosphohydrolase
MNFNSFRFKTGYVDADRLLREGLDWGSIVRTITLGVSYVQDALFVIVSDGIHPDCCTERTGYVDLLYAQIALSQTRLKHLTLDCVIAFNRSVCLTDAVELIPEVPLSSQIQEHHHFIVPGTRAVPLMFVQPSSPFKSKFNAVLFAGSFDHLHGGHKTVITWAFFLARKRFYVGLTSDSLISGKRCSSALEPYSMRLKRTQRFIEEFRPGCAEDLEVVYLVTEDPVGPAATLDFEALIVTPETISGGRIVNEARSLAGANPVEIVVIEILGKADVKQKLSSTSIREGICSALPTGEPQVQALQTAFFAMLKPLMIPLDKQWEWWSKLRDSYCLKPWKYYHTLRHVSELLDLAKLQFGEAPPIELLLSIWFHDVVYDPRSYSNEDNSLELFNQFVSDCPRAEKLDIESISRAILATKAHTSALCESSVMDHPWIGYFLEMDLAILGGDRPRYEEYASDIRREYFFLNDSEFSMGRRAFLSTIGNFEFKLLRQSEELNKNLSANVLNELSALDIK